MRKIVLSLRPVGLFSLGSTHPRALGPDVPFAAKPVHKDGKIAYVLYIPGSSVKGALRSAASRIAGHDIQPQQSHTTAFKFTTCNESLSKFMRECDVCNLFGKPGVVYPKVFFGDFECEKSSKHHILTKVDIDDKSLTASEHALYSVEYISRQTIFKGEISYIRLTEKELELLLLAIAELRLDRLGRASAIDAKIEQVVDPGVPPKLREIVDELGEWLWG